jgi:hypothetical protein
MSAQAQHITMNTLPPHHSFRHIGAHDANKDAVVPSPLSPRVHKVEHTGRRSAKSGSDEKYTTVQEALQLARRKLEMQVGGKGRQGLV